MKFKDSLIRFMYGRYGCDKLCYALFFVSLLIMIVNLFFRTYILEILSMLVLVLIFFRMFSRNILKRRAENEQYERLLKKVKPPVIRFFRRIREIRTYRFRKCPHCKSILHLPRKTGKHTVVCPICKNEFELRILF